MSPTSPQMLANQLNGLNLNSSVPRFFLHLDYSFRRTRNIYLLHNNCIRFSALDLSDFIDYLLKSSSSIIMANPRELMGRILFRNPSENYKYPGSSLYGGSGLKKLIGLFDKNQSRYMGTQSQLLRFSYEIEKEFKRLGKIQKKMFINSDDPHDNTINIIGPFYFPAESRNMNQINSPFSKVLELPQNMQARQQMEFNKIDEKHGDILDTGDKRQNNPLINRTFDSSFFNNPSEKEAFNVSQLNTSKFLNMNIGNQTKLNSFGKFEKTEEIQEDYHQSEYSQPNVTSYNGQCPYFVNEKQYDAIIRRRRKKQKRMLLYGKSIIFF